MSGVLQMIADDLLLPIDEIRHTIAFAQVRNRRFKIKKRTSGYRVIVQPSVKLKPILNWLDAYILKKLPVHRIATAFCPGISILENARAHSASNYSVRVDISNFFPSVNWRDLVETIKANQASLEPWACSAEALVLIAKVCFDREGKLPIGYSTSPSIANAVMHQIDSELFDRISKVAVFGNAAVTRYADDFVFSTDKVGACNEFVLALAEILAANECPMLVINEGKTKFMSRAGGSTLITGLRVNNQSNVVVHADYRDHVRLLLKLYKSNRLMSEDVPKLIGHLAYLQHVDAALFTKLSFKYYQEIFRLRGGTVDA